MAPTRFTGKALVVTWKKDGAPAAVVLTGDGRAFEFTHEQGTADGTAGADLYEVSLATVKKASASLEILMNSAATWDADLKLGDTGELRWYPQGMVAGKPEWGISAIVTNMSQSIPYDNAAKYTTDFKNNGTALLAEGTAYVGP